MLLEMQILGINLEYEESNHQGITFKREFNRLERFKMYNDLMKSISILHDNGLVHLDLKPDNLMTNKVRGIFDYSEIFLVLTDFELMKKVN